MSADIFRASVGGLEPYEWLLNTKLIIAIGDIMKEGNGYQTEIWFPIWCQGTPHPINIGGVYSSVHETDGEVEMLTWRTRIAAQWADQ